MNFYILLNIKLFKITIIYLLIIDIYFILEKIALKEAFCAVQCKMCFSTNVFQVRSPPPPRAARRGTALRRGGAAGGGRAPSHAPAPARWSASAPPPQPAPASPGTRSCSRQAALFFLIMNYKFERDRYFCVVSVLAGPGSPDGIQIF